ncbi:uncharacterized protein LOC144152146 isoform X2 [Haemaphysalis longicornis]
METKSKLLVASLALLYLSLPSDGGSGPKKLQRETPDAYLAFEAFPYALGVADNDNDTIFECLNAKRRDFDLEGRTVTYDWSLSTGPGQERLVVSLHHLPGDTIDSAPFTVDDDTTVYDGYVSYTDYRDCAVTEVPIWNNQRACKSCIWDGSSWL